MSELKFDSGLKTFRVNDKCDISFNPTDADFTKQLYAAFDLLGSKQQERREKASSLKDAKEFFDFSHALDVEMRGIIDGIFGENVSQELFGNMNVYAYGDGLPVWANFMLAVIDQLDASIQREKTLSNPRIAKYTKKYHR